MRLRCVFLLFVTALACNSLAAAKPVVLDASLHHLRAAGPPEWSGFPARAEGAQLSIPFQGQRNAAAWSLRLRQQDVKQTWKVVLNGKELGRLLPDENDTVVYYAVPPGRLRDGDNRLRIEQVGKIPDDIRVGEMILDNRPVAAVLSEATIDVVVLEAGRGRERPPWRSAPVPCRITVLNAQGALMTVGAKSGGHLAVRPGVIYTGDGKARFGLPAGDYTLIAGRGFEYGIASTRITVRPGDKLRRTLTIHREVPTPGYISCDTHVHTLTYSGHGDASADERVLTLAGEGVELPIITDHNVQVDYRAAAVRKGVQDYFTLVTGNEVTTSVGHFNIFPAPVGDRVPDFRLKDWKSLSRSIAERTGARAIILNHPRDLHAGFRPFGPARHLALTGENLDGWQLPANAMEVVNSGAQQTDVLRLFRDWFGMLNGGVLLTPVGASDSHDVSRFIVGQGRTYIRCSDDRPGAIDVRAAVKSFVEGRVLVSCGLLAEITINGKYGPGDLAPAAGEVKVAVRVLGPSWTTADRVELYANGRKVREAIIKDGGKAGVKWRGEWTLPRFRHDVYLVAVASGPGVTGLHWPIARPYQPTSPVVRRRVIGATGAVWFDGDGDGKRTSARDYARRLQRQAGGDWKKLVASLGAYDEAVAAQAASLLRVQGMSIQDKTVQAAVRAAGAQVCRGFEAYSAAWRESQLARDSSR